MSYPHFYNSDPYYLSAVDGLKPNKEKHEFFFIIEPVSGLILEVGGGFQTNILIDSIHGIR